MRQCRVSIQSAGQWTLLLLASLAVGFLRRCFFMSAKVLIFAHLFIIANLCYATNQNSEWNDDIHQKIIKTIHKKKRQYNSLQ